ncbi:MAG: hypothetical protein RLN88_12330 [Ekhidna sp.]|uniref:hypothetical protein n=1 Tax=Ekhidna sp. TaxID=2608089 RepID=UPI0032EB8DBA
MKYFAVLVTLVFFSCGGSSSKDKTLTSSSKEELIDDKEESYFLTIDSSLIDSLFVDIEELKLYFEGLKEINYSLIKSADLSDSVFNGNYKLSIYDIDYASEPSDDQLYYDSLFGRETDTSLPGDFMKIKIEGKGIYSLKNLDGWSKVPSKFRTESEHFLIIDLGLRSPVLIFFSEPYASQPHLLTIIGFDDEGPKLIFNQKRNLISIREDELLVTDEFDKYSRIYGLDDRIMIHQNPKSLN